MRPPRVAASIAGGLALALALPGQALAHATLSSTSPSSRERVKEAPRLVRLHFDQSVKALPDAIAVRTAGGRLVSGAARNGSDHRDVVVPVGRLRTGPYTVRWQAISSDGHVVSGVFTFGVRYPAPPPTEAFGATGPTTTEHVVRWAYFLALALLVGGAGFRLLALPRPLPRAAERRFFLVTGLGAAGALEVGVLAFVLRAEDALRLPFERLLYGNLEPIATGTRFGTAFVAMTLGFALVSAFLFLAWLTDRTWPLWPVLILGLSFASGLSLSGHSAVDHGSSWLSAAADWVHLSAATLWLGGLVQLAVVVWPLAPELRARAFLAFSRLATVLVAFLLGAGIYLSVLRFPHVADLWATGYGRVLLAKLALVCLALGWGAVHHFVARPVLERAPEAGLLARLSRSLVGESAVGMAVLLAAAVLVDSKPPPQPPAGPTRAVNVSG
jgi:copper transport protein